MNDPDQIRKALERARTVAVVGCSPNPDRPSHAIASYLLGAGYTVVPVNPGHREILGRPCFPSLLEVPRQTRIDIVDVFRARVVDVAPDSLIIEVTGADEKIDGLLEILKPFGVLEVAKTGCLAMARGPSGRSAARTAGASADHIDASVSFSV